MDDNADVVAPNEGDIAIDMDFDYDNYAEDKDEAHDDEETYVTMKNDWQGRSNEIGSGGSPGIEG
ncbi:hypothetical protein AMTR_s00074p00038380 [Amborella trichopoda]|uniref:Uncharacterized protein n=1 Tax=Amborella trichopoda TaxID=13333 RepID=W1NQ38_AMBTC|nr:hypothetical protein AMTR_s00074p00038380 [Amborella trichopoda]